MSNEILCGDDLIVAFIASIKKPAHAEIVVELCKHGGHLPAERPICVSALELISLRFTCRSYCLKVPACHCRLRPALIGPARRNLSAQGLGKLPPSCAFYRYLGIIGVLD